MASSETSLSDRINADFKTALKSRQADQVSALRMIRSALTMKEKESGATLDDETVTAVLKTLAKQRRDAAEQFDKGDRPEMAAKERAELELIQGYLPAQVDEATVRRVAAEVIAELKADSPKQMGPVMKATLAKLGQGADGKLVSGVVRELLSK